MKQQFGNTLRIYLVLSASFLLLAMGCKTCGGFDPKALGVKDATVDYGNLVKEGKPPIEAILYGQLGPGISTGSDSNALSVRFDDILGAIENIKNLDPTSANLTAWGDALEQDIKANIGKHLVDAAKTANGAKILADATEPYVKTAGSLGATVKTGESHVPTAKREYKTRSDKLVVSFERLYQSAVATALGFAQRDANSELGKFETALARLDQYLEDVPQAIVSPVQRQAAQAALVNADNKQKAMRTYISLITSSTKVEANLSAAKSDLATALTQVKTDYIAKVDPSLKSEADNQILDAGTAYANLDTFVGNYLNIEALKTPTGGDAKLVDLVDRAFLGEVSVSLGKANINEETDINRLLKLFTIHDLVVLTRDNSSRLLVEALASSVVYKVAQQFGLSAVDNVVGPDAQALIKAKKDFSMSEDEYKDFLGGFAQNMRKEQNKAGRYKNLFVVFADDIGGDVSGMVHEFLQENGKVLVIDIDDSKYTNFAGFAHDHLQIPEGVVLANAIIKEKNPDIDPALVSEPLVKIYAAFGDLRIGDLRPAVTDALSRLSKGRKARSDDITTAVLAALTDRKVPTDMVKLSGINSDTDLNLVQKQLKTDRNFYKDKAGAGSAAMKGKLLDAQQKAAAASTNQQARQAKITMLNTAYNGYKGDVATTAKNVDVFAKETVYRYDVEEYLKDAIGTLASMNDMLDDALCIFRSAPDYDGGHEKFLKRVSGQLYDQASIENPISLFTVSDKTVTVRPGLDASRNAAIGLNCFLTGPGRAYANNGRLVLKDKVAKIEAEVNRVIRDAQSLGSNLRDPDPLKLEAAYKILDDRMKEMVAGTFNNKYWKKELSTFTPMVPVKKPALGELFNVSNYIKPYPIDHSNPEILPPKAGINNLPESFFAKYRTGTRPIYTDGNNEYSVTEVGNFWTIARIYGVALEKAGKKKVGSTLDLAKHYANPIPAYNEFLEFNQRFWAWFLSRLVGKIPVPMAAALYANQGGVNYFNKKHVFIDRLFNRTEAFLQDANRYILTQMALEVLKDYKAMAEHLYNNLTPAEFNDFLGQAPATTLSTFFNKIESIMKAKDGINSIAVDDKTTITRDWFDKFFHADITNGLVAAIAGPAPTAGKDVHVASIWPSLKTLATKISGDRVKNSG